MLKPCARPARLSGGRCKTLIFWEDHCSSPKHAPDVKVVVPPDDRQSAKRDEVSQRVRMVLASDFTNTRGGPLGKQRASAPATLTNLGRVLGAIGPLNLAVRALFAATAGADKSRRTELPWPLPSTKVTARCSRWLSAQILTLAGEDSGLHPDLRMPCLVRLLAAVFYLNSPLASPCPCNRASGLANTKEPCGSIYWSFKDAGLGSAFG